MRKLHPVGPHELLQHQGRLRRPSGQAEDFTVHGLPGERRAVRVEVPGAELWHLTLDEDGRPERMEARLTHAGRTLETTATFFDDEVLIWRRGGEPASEAVAVPPGYRLLWPPVAGREACLTGVAGADGAAEAVMCLLVRRRPQSDAWLQLRPVKFTVRQVGRHLSLATPGLAEAEAELDDQGWLVRWAEGDAVWERETG